MHCLDTSLIEGKTTCFGFAPACGWHHLALWHCSWSWPSGTHDAWSKWVKCSRGRSPTLYIRRNTSAQGVPLPVGPLFGFRSLPLACCFVSIPLESEVKWARHGSLGSETDWALSSPFLSCSLKTKDNKTLLTESVILSQIWTLAIILECHSLLFKSSSQCVPVPQVSPFPFERTGNWGWGACDMLSIASLKLKNMNVRNFQTYPKGERLVLSKPQKPIVLVWKLPGFTHVPIDVCVHSVA